jgi:hypothetical protein
MISSLAGETAEPVSPKAETLAEHKGVTSRTGTRGMTTEFSR